MHGVYMSNDSMKFEAALKHSDFVAMKSTVARMLYMLSLAYDQRGKDFDKLLTLRRGDLKLFAKSSSEIQKSALDPRPQSIPNTPFWVATKTSTESKRKIVRDALRMLGYDDKLIEVAVLNLS